MLNPTNRTLSANTNQLNLGTRSLVLASGFNGKQNSLTRHAHGLSMRVGMSWSSHPSIPSIAIPNIPGSSPVVSWPVVGLRVRLASDVSHAHFATPAVRQTKARPSKACQQPARATTVGKRPGQSFAPLTQAKRALRNNAAAASAARG